MPPCHQTPGLLARDQCSLTAPHWLSLFFCNTSKNCQHLNQTLSVRGLLFKTMSVMSHHHYSQVQLSLECVHCMTYDQFFITKFETLRKLCACGFARVIINQLWIQEPKVGPQEMKSQSEVKLPA